MLPTTGMLGAGEGEPRSLIGVEDPEIRAARANQLVDHAYILVTGVERQLYDLWPKGVPRDVWHAWRKLQTPEEKEREDKAVRRVEDFLKTLRAARR